MWLHFKIKAIVPFNDDSNLYTVYIFNTSKKVLIPITTNRWGAESLILALSGSQTVRPSIHNSFMRTLNALGAKLLSVCVYKYQDDVFYTYLILRSKYNLRGLDGDDTSNREVLEYEIDIKATDAFALAILLGKPILVSKYVYDEAGIVITKEFLDKCIGEV